MKLRLMLSSLLLAVALANTSAAVVTGAASADSISCMPVLLNQPLIRKDLNLTAPQTARIDLITAECRAKVGVLSAVGLLDPTLSPLSIKDLPAYQRSCNNRALAVLSSEQRVRFRQIERQFHGGLFLLSPSEQKLLGLTSDQSHKIVEIRATDAAKAAEVQKDFLAGKKSQLRREIDLNRIHRTTARSLLHLLTPEQQQAWLSSLGTPLKK
jgi:hypothetical protein